MIKTVVDYKKEVADIVNERFTKGKHKISEREVKKVIHYFSQNLMQVLRQYPSQVDLKDYILFRQKRKNKRHPLNF